MTSLMFIILFLITVTSARKNIAIDNLVNRTFTADSEHYCTYRYFDPYPSYHFQLLTGWSCYNYAQPKWMHGGKILKPRQGVLNNLTQFKVPYVVVEGKGVIFDYEDAKYLETIRNLHVEGRFFDKWLNCAESAMKCCTQLKFEDLVATNEYPCPAMWDGYTCYEKTPPNTNVKKLCPLYLTTMDKFICDLESVKECNIDGWNQQTEYQLCSSSFRLRDRHTFHVIVLGVASSVMLPSIFIFFAFDKLKQTWRIILHRNVVLAIFLKNVLVITSKNIIIMDAISVQAGDSVMENDGTWCRVLTFFENLSKNLIFTCMTADAYHSHKTIARAFSTDTNVYIMYGIIAVASCIPTIVWSILMGVNDAGKCWVSDTSGYQWVTDGYKYACLAINVIFLLDIIRVLFMKFRQTPSKHGTAFKATIILLCLFGIPLLISAQRNIVDMDDCFASDVYTYVTYSIEAFQGIFMALFFCYLNKDALNELKRTWRQLMQHIHERSSSLRETIRRRTTLMTNTTQVSSKS